MTPAAVKRMRQMTKALTVIWRNLTSAIITASGSAWKILSVLAKRLLASLASASPITSLIHPSPTKKLWEPSK